MSAIDQFFNKITNLPMLPKVVQEVTLMLNDEDVDYKQLAHKIDHDLVMSAKILRLSNSSYYGASRTVKTIDEAITLIGLRNLKTLVVASGVTAAFTNVQGLDLKRFWRHSLVTASIARQLCVERKQDSETAYIAALMHSIGQLPIHIVFPIAGAEVESMCKGLCVLERKSIEHSVIGLDHCEVGEELAKRWNFPVEIQRVIRYYADPMHDMACTLAPLVYMAAHISFDIQANKPADEIAQTLNPHVAKIMDVDLAAFPERIETYRAFVKEADSYI